jgi:hypothetical protein
MLTEACEIARFGHAGVLTFRDSATAARKPGDRIAGDSDAASDPMAYRARSASPLAFSPLVGGPF